MALHSLRRGQRVKLAGIDFVIVQRLPVERWQLQNTATGEYCIFAEVDLLDRFAQDELSFNQDTAGRPSLTDRLAAKLTRDLATYPPS